MGRFRWLRAPSCSLAALGASLGLVPNSAIADPYELPLPALNIPSDSSLTMRVRSLLGADPSLQSADLMVSVVDGGIVVGGAVAVDADRARVQALCERIAGATSVKVSCWVRPTIDPLHALVRQRAATAAPSSLPMPLENQPRANELAQLYDRRPSGSRMSLRYEEPMPNLPSLWEPASLRPSGYSPVPGPAPAKPTGPAQYPTIAPPSLPTMPAQDVAAAAEELRRSYGFESVGVAHRAGVLTVSGQVPSMIDFWQFAQDLRRIPGVEQVIVGRVSRR